MEKGARFHAAASPCIPLPWWISKSTISTLDKPSTLRAYATATATCTRDHHHHHYYIIIILVLVLVLNIIILIIIIVITLMIINTPSLTLTNMVRTLLKKQKPPA
jgi:hypothetical protein